MGQSNNSGAGTAIAPVAPMIPGPGPNFSDNNKGNNNVPNIYITGSTVQNKNTIRISTNDTGIILGAVSGSKDGPGQPMTGSSKYYIQGSPATGQGDMSLVNNGNAVATQMVPSQNKYLHQ